LGVGYGAIGGAASAALSPDLLKAIDPTGAALSPGQQAAMEGFATLLGGGLAGLAGANAQGGANAALNEVMNNTDDHPETAAKNGGVLGAFGNLLSAVGDQLASAGRGALNLGSMLAGMVQSGAQQKMSESPSDLVAQGVANGITAVSGSGGGLPPGAGLDPVLASPGAGQAPSSVIGGTPSNATLASGNSGDTGTSVTGTGSDDVNLASPDRTNHILNGDATGGGHLWPGGPGKSAFPADWSASQIMNTVSDIATDPTIPETVQSNGRIVKEGTSNGVNIRVVIEPPSKGGGIVTAFPTNVPRNPK
jgi:filamentous hemagglutinin